MFNAKRTILITMLASLELDYFLFQIYFVLKFPNSKFEGSGLM